MQRNTVFAFIGLLLLAGCGGVAWSAMRPGKPSPVTAVQPIPITAGVAERKDVPVYLTGLGAVQAFNSVTVKVRVDGELEQVLFTEGQDVKAGDVLAKIDSTTFQAQLEQAVAKKQLDEATLANAKLDLERFVYLLKTDAVPAQRVDTQRATVAELEAQVKLDQGAIDNAKAFLDYCTVASPIDGRTGVRLVDKGNIVHAADPNGLVVINQIEPISILFTLPENELGEIFAAKAAGPLKVIATARADQHELAEGTLVLVDNQINQNTGTVQLKATFPNKDHALWPGQFVNARLLLRTLPQAVTVPSTAVQRGPDGMYVYAIKPDSTVEIRPVDVSILSDGTAVIDKGLEPGTRIVVAGQYRVQSGSLVEPAGQASKDVAAAGHEAKP